jgi:hypothetical protein
MSRAIRLTGLIIAIQIIATLIFVPRVHAARPPWALAMRAGQVDSRDFASPCCFSNRL